MESLQSVQHRKLDWSTVNIRPDLGKPEFQDLPDSHGPIHPEQLPPPMPFAQSNDQKVQAVTDYIGRIASISESDYGDWMRRANLYWLTLVEALHGVGKPGVQESLQEMASVIEFNPNFRILETSR